MDGEERCGERDGGGWRQERRGVEFSRESLVQSSNSLGAEGAGALVPALAKMTGLQTLYLVRWLWV